MSKNSVATFKYGTPIAFAEPSWYQFFESPYYTDSHRAFREKVRQFIEKEVKPFVDDWEERHVSEGFEIPLEVFRKAYAAGVYSPQFPTELGGTPPPGGFDAFHDLILNDELARANCSGITSGFTIYTMALPPILKYGSQYIKDLVVRDILMAKKFIALCISEPYAGSDVANIRATAVRDGDHFVINAEKKWITWAWHADYFTVAARTGEKGHRGLSLFLVDRKTPGITIRRMKLQGGWLAGTSMVLFDNVRVPAINMIGQENAGFKMMMHNFNHERYVIAVQANRGSRCLLEESLQYASQRKTFGKTLIEHQVIRQKLADMAMRIEGVHAHIENLTYQMSKGLSDELLGGSMALLKVFATRTLELCNREASQIFGGASYVRGGVGVRIERSAREVRGAAVPGGSDEILADLAIRQAMLITMRARAANAQLSKSKSKL